MAAMSAAFALFCLGVAAGFVAFNDWGRADTLNAFRDGRAQVVTYTVPREGECKAVLIDGRRQAEKCEGETP